MRLLIYILSLSLFMLPIYTYAQDSDQVWKKQAQLELSTTPINESGKTTYAYGKDTLEMRNLLNLRTKEVRSLTGMHGKDPVLWYIRGELAHLKQLLYHIDLKKAGKPYVLGSPENQALIKAYQSYSLKALDLDDDPDAPDHLTVDMLMTISDDVLADPEIKEKALQKEMALAQSGSFVSENPNYEWETYEVMLENYIQQQDYDNYLKTVNEMIERFPNSSQMDSLLEAKRQAEEAIKLRHSEVIDVRK